MSGYVLRPASGHVPLANRGPTDPDPVRVLCIGPLCLLVGILPQRHPGSITRRAVDLLAEHSAARGGTDPVREEPAFLRRMAHFFRLKTCFTQMTVGVVRSRRQGKWHAVLEWKHARVRKMRQAGAWAFFEVRDGRRPRAFHTKARSPFLIATPCVVGFDAFSNGRNRAVSAFGEF